MDRSYEGNLLGAAIEPMRLYVFLISDQDEKVLTAAKKVVHSRGASVVKSMAGATLLELAPAQIPEIAQALPGWRSSVERKTTRVLERKPLLGSKARAALAAAAKG